MNVGYISLRFIKAFIKFDDFLYFGIDLAICNMEILEDENKLLEFFNIVIF